MYPFAFFGSPRFADVVLKELIEGGYLPSVLVCNPDRPVGRKRVVTPPATKERILSDKEGIRENVEILQPETKKELVELKERFKNCEFAVVAAYSKIIPKEVLEVFPKGVIGVHPSLLPKHRGPSPIQGALLEGVGETGVTLYLLDEETDHGDILANSKLQIANGETYEMLEEKLATLGGELLVRTLPSFLAGEIKPKEQDHSQATFTKMIHTEDGLVDLEKDSPIVIDRKIKALNPEPGVYTIQDGKRVKLLEGRWEDEVFVITKTLPEGKKVREAHIVLKKN